MPSYKYVIELSEQDKSVLLDIVTKGASSGAVKKHPPKKNCNLPEKGWIAVHFVI